MCFEESCPLKRLLCVVLFENVMSLLFLCALKPFIAVDPAEQSDIPYLIVTADVLVLWQLCGSGNMAARRFVSEYHQCH